MSMVRSLPVLSRNSLSAKVWRCHASPGVKVTNAGANPVEREKSMSRAGLPSPFVQKEIDFFPDRFAGAMIVDPGLNIAPAQAQGSGGLVLPLMRSACFV